MANIAPQLMSTAEVADLLGQLPSLEAAVVGDFCLDVYWSLELRRSEISVETGLPTRPVSEQRYSPGGAGNVLANLAALGCGRVHAIGIVGDDPCGRELTRLLDVPGIDASGMIRQSSDFATLAYIKPLADNTEQSRFDFGDFNVVHPETVRKVVRHLESVMPGVQAVLINQQVPEGVHSSEMREALADVISRYPETPFIVDSRDYNDSFPGAMLKLNHADCPAAYAQERYDQTGRPVFVTSSANGCAVADAAGVVEIPAVEITGEIDSVGAGDAYFAGVGAAIAAGATPARAAIIGTLAAAVTVTKLRQTGTASRDELMVLLQQSGFLES